MVLLYSNQIKGIGNVLNQIVQIGIIPKGTSVICVIYLRIRNLLSLKKIINNNILKFHKNRYNNLNKTCNNKILFNRILISFKKNGIVILVVFKILEKDKNVINVNLSRNEHVLIISLQVILIVLQ